MTFFDRYFDSSTAQTPHSSLELVAKEVEFSIQWAPDATRKSSQFLGGLTELRGFIDAGDTEGWAHHVVNSGVNGNVEFALGETRWDTGERIGTFLAVAQLDEAGRMRKYMVARSPALAFPEARDDRETPCPAHRPGPDRRHQTGAQTHRLRLPTVRNRGPFHPSLVPAVHLRRSATA